MNDDNLSPVISFWRLRKCNFRVVYEKLGPQKRTTFLEPKFEHRKLSITYPSS